MRSSVRKVDNSALAMEAIRRGARLGVLAGNLLVETEAKLLAPVATGNHRRSIGNVIQESGDVITGIIGHQSDYGQFLELGTRHMAPRPHFRPALDHKGTEAQRAITAGIARELEATLPPVGVA